MQYLSWNNIYLLVSSRTFQNGNIFIIGRLNRVYLTHEHPDENTTGMFVSKR